jgi:hypothetical protein
MAKIKTNRIKQRSLSGEVMEFSSEITVASDGVFAATIPEELEPTATALAGAPEWRPHVRVDRARVNHRITGRMLDKIEEFIRAAVIEHLSVEITRERVILYAHTNKTSFSRATDGTIHPNGYFAGEGAQWAGNSGISASNVPRQFSVGLTACVRDKVTYTRPSGSRVVYDKPEGEGADHWDQTPLTRLNAFILSGPTGGGGDTHEMPYSDKAANFFADMLLAMCRLGEQLDQFLGDKDRLSLAIDRGALLLANGATEPE